MFWAEYYNRLALFDLKRSEQLMRGNFFNLTVAAMLGSGWYGEEKKVLDLVDKAYKYCDENVVYPDVSKNPVDLLKANKPEK